MKRGDQFIAFPDERPKSRLYVTVTRVAKDDSWADITVQTWAVMWRKRQPLLPGGGLPAAVPATWGQRELVAQQSDHMAWLKEEGRL